MTLINHGRDLFDVELEQALIGAVLTDNSNYWRVECVISASDFYDPMHGRLWTAIGRQTANGNRATPVTLRPFADTDDGIKEVGGRTYLENLARSASPLPNSLDYARQIIDLARRRSLVEAATAAIDAAYLDHETSSQQIADKANEALYDAAHRGEASGRPEDIEGLMMQAAKAAEHARNDPQSTYISTGLCALDTALGGLFLRDLTVLGAAPNMGKTGLAQQIALTAAMAKRHVVFFSLEMGALEICTRYAAYDVHAPADRIEQGRISETEMDQLAAAVGAYQALPLAIDETPNLSVAQIRARCHALRRKKGNVDLCVIDHLRFITPADRHADERDQIQQITRDLKQMAKELNIAILLVVHLNRGIWSRDNKRPVLSDLYGSSGIEQNADHVWFLHREEYYLERQQPDCSDHKKYDEWLTRVLQSKGRAEVFSAKRRRGPLGSANLKFDAPFARFLDPGA